MVSTSHWTLVLRSYGFLVIFPKLCFFLYQQESSNIKWWVYLHTLEYCNHCYYYQKWLSNTRIQQFNIATFHFSDVIMGAVASQITSLTIVYSAVYSGTSKKTSKLRGTGFCAGNSPVIGEFPAHMASNAENVSIWWRHHVFLSTTASCRSFFTVWKKPPLQINLMCLATHDVFNKIINYICYLLQCTNVIDGYCFIRPVWQKLNEITSHEHVLQMCIRAQGLHSANERHRYKVTPSPIGWVQY